MRFTLNKNFVNALALIIFLKVKPNKVWMSLNLPNICWYSMHKIADKHDRQKHEIKVLCPFYALKVELLWITILVILTLQLIFKIRFKSYLIKIVQCE